MLCLIHSCNRGLPIQDLDVLSTFDRHQISLWNQALPLGVDECIQNLFCRTAKENPLAIAVSAWDGAFSYAELDSETNKLANYLRTLDIAKESLVPLCFEKSIWMTVAVISVLKAGGVVVPLDASYPKNRLLGIIEDTAATIVLCESQFSSAFIDSGLGVVSDIPQLLTTLLEDQTPIVTEIESSDPAFILFTSGSTGKPKGIVHTHSTICSSVAAYAPALNLTANSRVLQFAAYSFDISVIDTIATLILGGCLCVPSEYERLNDITGFIQRSRCSWAFLTPSFARHIDPASVGTLTDLVLGGEDVPQDSVNAWSSPGRRIMNGYGPAECAICVTGELIPEQRPMIGHGIGCRTWVVDVADHSRLMPVGCVGELCIEGPIVFSGYLNDSKRSDSSFLHNPPWLRHEIPSKRKAYKTGDLVRYGTDGNLIYVGRRDSQIKLRGQRIELQEIEQQIRSRVPGIPEVVVTLIDPSGSSPILAALLKVEDALSIQLQIETIVTTLKDILPSYMIPSTFIPFQDFPLNQARKLDRRKLQAMASEPTVQRFSSSIRDSRDRVALSTRLELEIAGLWTKVSVIPSGLGANDNFFALGGDSLAAIALVAAARQKSLRISVGEILQNPYLSDMAMKLSALEATPSPCMPFEMLREVDVTASKGDIARKCQILIDEIEDIYPCTPLQEGLFALSTAYPETYVARIVYDIPKDVDLQRFKAAWNTVIGRNAVYRSRIVYTASETLQVVTSIPPELWQHGNDLEAYLKSDSKRPVGNGQSLLRLAMIASGDTQKFVMSVHHSIFDGWSLDLTWREVVKAYTQMDMPPAWKFNSFVHFLKHNGVSREDSRFYWCNQLQDSTPAAYPAVPSGSYRPKANAFLMHEFELRQSQTEVTLSMKIRASWAMLIAQYSGTRDVTFGLTLSGRFAPYQGIEDLVGPTIATVPIRIRLDPHMSVHEHLRLIQEQAISMIPYEHTGLQEIAKTSPEARDLCDFSSLLVIQPAPDVSHDSTPCLYDHETVDLGLPNALVVECRLTLTGIRVVVSYDGSILQHHEIEQLVMQLEHILRQICLANHDLKLKDIQLISPADMDKLLSWNKTLPPALDVCIHDQIEFQAAQNPDADAVCAWDGNLTYGELDRLASTLARVFSSRGVGPEVIVPLCFDKSKWVIVSLLAVLKAGGACLYLEPSWPVARVDFILTRVNATIVLAEPQYSSLFEGKVEHVLILSGALFQEETLPRALSPLQPVIASQAAFVMFTSGSTGLPKGIVQEHSSLYTSSINHASACNINSGSRVLQFSAFTFDVYIIEICTTLIHGGCLCVPSEFDRMNNLTRVMEDMRVNWAFFTPTFCRSMDPQQLPHLRTLLVGGEAVDRATIDKWVGHVQLVNCYGPAECGPSVMCNIGQSHRPESIGLPVCVVCWITDPDDHLKLAPIGSIGELVLEGYTMARGYLNEPEKTCASFVPAPKWLALMGPSRGSRLYRTGDLVRYSRNGAINFIGRKDTQVKVRGQRMELGEVEHHLRANLPLEVDTAAEVVRFSDSQERASLAAFISVKGEEFRDDAHILNEEEEAYERLALYVDGLQERLEASVPSNMIPATVLFVSKMPVSTSGKLDRKRLKSLAMDLSVKKLPRSRFALRKLRVPNTDIEVRLQSLWAKLLKIEEEISAGDHFFHLGADSITAMGLVTLARDEGLSLSVSQIFKYPRLSEMALQICPVNASQIFANIQSFELLPADIAIETVLREVAAVNEISWTSIEDIYPCTPLQEGLLALSVISPGTYTSQNIYDVPHSVDLVKFRNAWDLTTQQQPILRTRVLYTTHGTYQAVVKHPIEWHIKDDLHEYLKTDRDHPINAGERMARFALVSGKGESRGRFVLTLHHSIYDQWSLNLLWESVFRCYNSLSVMTTLPFAGFIKYILSSDKDQAKDYWRTQLEGASLTKFPDVGYGYQPMTSSLLKLPDTCHLPQAKVQSGYTTSTLLRAAWSLVVAKYTSTDDVTFGVIANGRTAPVDGIDRIVAPLIATVPIRVCINYSQTIHSFLEQLQLQAIEMLPFEHTGLQHIKRYLSADRQSLCDLQNLLVIQPVLDESKSFPEISCISGFSNFVVPHALVLECSLVSDGVNFQASYDPGILDSASVRRLLDQLAHVLTVLSASEPNLMLKALDMVGPVDRCNIFQTNVHAPETIRQSIHGLIQQQSAGKPDSIAIHSWDGEMSYGRLDELSTRLAVNLQGMGVNVDVTVPLLFEKSLWACVALLGVLKAGAAFVLIDRATSIQRLKVILTAVNAKVLLLSQTSIDELIGLTTVNMIKVDERELAQLLPLEAGFQPPITSPNNIAYISFTSGTTSSNPKAAVIDHSAYCSGQFAHAEGMVDRSSRVLQFASYNFDGAIFEILTPLMRGGCVCIPSERDRLDDIAGFMNRAKVNLAILTPTIARAAIIPSSLRTLQTLILVGESMTREDILRYRGSGIRLLNGYGLTECCVCCALSDAVEGNIGTIGKPLGSNFWVTDANDHDRLAPVGTVGELLIEGPILARGYLDDHVRTAASFISNPAWSKQFRQMRLYKTGDLVRYNTNSTLTLIGRKDMQVKLRGQRIDLPEVERLVKRGFDNEVTDVACTLMSPSKDSKSSALAAFVCFRHGIARNDGTLIAFDSREQMRNAVHDFSAHVLADIPPHMKPTFYVPVTHIPLLTSGKIDRRKLAKVAGDLTAHQLADFSSSTESLRIPPSTEMEIRLAKNWAAVLQIDQEIIGVHDSFFLWGDSISVIRLTAVLRDDGLTISAAEIISHPLLSEMAGLLTSIDNTIVSKIPAPYSLLSEDSFDVIEEVINQCALDRDALEDIYPCTPLQEGLMALSVKNNDSYVARNVLRLPKSLDAERFMSAWAVLVDSHPILRTRIVQMKTGKALQVVLRENISWYIENDLEGYLEEDRRKITHFGDTLNRFALIDSAEQRHFVWTSHHATYDGWSVDLLFRQLDHIHRGVAINELLNFNIFIEHIQTSSGGLMEAFWRTQAKGEEYAVFPALPNSIYKPNANRVLTHEVSTHQRNGLASTSLYAAWAYVSARYSDANESVFGIVLNGRTAAVPNIDKIVGPTIATVPLRIRLEAQHNLQALTKNVESECSKLAPFAHAGLQNIRKISPEAERLCDFQTIVVVQPVSLVHMPCGTTLSSENPQDLSNFNNYGLMLECKPSATSLEITASFDENLIEPGLMRRMLKQFGLVLKRFTEFGPNSRLRDIKIATNEDMRDIKNRNRLLPGISHTLVHDLIATQVEARSDDTAICSWNGSITYRKLQTYSSNLATHIHKTFDPKRGSIIPLAFERSLWTTVCLLAVLKTGCAVILLDPAHPPARRQEIISEANVGIVLCDQKFAMEIVAKNILVITPAFITSLADGHVPSLDIDPEDPAFIISTSGSTGKPKLMVHTHRGIACNILAYGSGLKLDCQSRILQYAAYSFDISINEMLAALIYGGCLCVPSEHDRMNNVVGCINELKANWMFATPSFIAQTKILPKVVPSLKTLLIGGEATSQDILDAWKNDVDLLTAYGPAECQLCTVGTLQEPRDIGIPSGCLCWVTDPEDINKLLPFGMVGELIVQGPIVARGYLNADETAFCVRPSWFEARGDAHDNIYRTGDLVKYNARGSITYIGRKDSQVKLRGQRLELADVEYHVRELLPEHIAVVAEISSYGDRQILIGFISSTESTILTREDAEQYLNGIWSKMRNVLPSYMVPTSFVRLDTLPLTTSGKTDRKELRKLRIDTKDMIGETSTRSCNARPLSKAEQVLQSVWSEVLKLSTDQIGADEDFFRLGGDSILAIRLVSVARTRDVHLTVAEIFNTRSLGKMATLQGVPAIDEDPSPFSMLQGNTVETMKLAAEQCGVEEDRIEDIYPCSPLQGGLFALSQKAGAYIAQSVFRLPLDLDLVAFKAAWQDCAYLNAILRTSIAQTSTNGLVQVVLKNAISWAISSNLIEYMNANDIMQFGEPLTRFAIVEDRFFVLTQHHAAYDGHSLPHIYRQVEDIYKGLELIVKPISYSRFLKYLISVNGDESKKFWTTELARANVSDFPVVSPTYQPSPSSYVQQTYTGLNSAISVTMSTLIYAGWALIVSSYSRTHDVIFGATLSGRKASVHGIEQITGPTITTVPMRVNIDMAVPIDTYMENLQKKIAMMIPFEQAGLQNIAKLSPDARIACRLQNNLIVHAESQSVQGNSSIHVPYSIQSHRDANFRTYALNVECTILDKSTISIEAFFDPTIIDELTMSRILDQFGHVLKQLSDNTGQSLKDLDFASPQDMNTILDWNSHSILSTPEKCLHLQVKDIAESYPGRPAVCSWDGDLSYQDLERLSSRLAYNLSTLGVGPEVNVPLCFEKSLWVVVAVMAVMKAGGCVVPLDPSHPKKRLMQIVEQVKASIVLASTKYHTLLPSSLEVSAGTIDQFMPLTTDYYSSTEVRLANALYTIFTSGSTGQPKGVIIEHQAFLAGSYARRHLLKLCSASRVLQFSSYSFDVSMEDILSTLLAGGCVCIPSEEDRINDLVLAMRKLRVNHANLTPSVASLISPSDVPDLKVLALGGEPMTENNVQTWSNNVHLINFYGPTECSVTVSIYPHVAYDTHPKNIGHAVGCSRWITEFGNHDKLAPIGATGELLVEGPLLARGYLDDQTKTKAAFIENPRWAQSYKRLYKTGDLVRYDSDGSIIYVDRVEEAQIKVRGQRVELGEIEHHMRMALPKAQTVVVQLLNEGLQPPLLVAFVSTSQDLSSSAILSSRNSLRVVLEENLPSHMVPSMIIPIEILPLTSAGKIDRRELHHIGQGLLSMGKAIYLDASSARSQTPSTDLEREMQRIWAHVLNIPISNVSVAVPIFNLGGDSISAIQVVGRCRSQGINVSTYDVLKCKTIANICKSVGSKNHIEARSRNEKVKMEENFDLSPMQREHFLLMPNGNNMYQQSFLLQLSQKFSYDRLMEVLYLLAMSHPMLQARFSKAEDGRWTQRLIREANKDNLLHYNPQGTIDDIRDEVDRSIDIQNGPVFAAGLIEKENGQLMYITIHHLAVDLVSWRIILRDIEETLLNPEAAIQPEPLSFPSWCQLQVDFSHSDNSQKEALEYITPAAKHDYWDMQCVSNTYEETISKHFVIDERISTLLLGQCNTALRTEPVEIFIAAIYHSFTSSFGNREPSALFGEGHGRESWDDSIDLSRTVGWFTTMYPMNVRSGRNIVEAIIHTKDARRSIPRKGYSYFTARHLNEKSSHPIPAEIIFNYQGAFQQLERDDSLLQLLPIDNPSFSRYGSNVERPALFEISVAIHNKQIRFDFVFNRHMSHQDRISDWIHSCLQFLQEASLLLTKIDPQYTRSDFPLLPLDIQGFSGQIAQTLPRLPGKVEDIYPCSPMQRSMFLSQARGSKCYQPVMVWKAKATIDSMPVDLARLGRAWQLVIDRNSILRTCVMKFDKHAVQVVLGKYQADTVIVDKDGIDKVLPLSESLSHFDQTTRPMHRLHLCPLSDGMVLCRLEISHILIDGASLVILLQQLASAYDLAGSEAQKGLVYKELVRHVQEDRSQETIDYWKHYIGGAPPCNFPTDSMQLYASSRSVNVELLRLQSRLHPFCKEVGITISTLFQAVWSLVLRIYTHQDDISFGYVVSGRNLPLKGSLEAVGPYFNLLCCRLNLNSEITLSDILEAAQADAISSIRHQDFSLPEIDDDDAGWKFNTLVNFRKFALSDVGESQSSIAFDLVEAYDPFDVSI